jgi:hypothetical protein
MGLAWCLAALGVRAPDRVGPEHGRAEISEGAGSSGTVVEVTDWDPAVTWAFRSRDGYIGYEGLFQAPDKLDITRTPLDRPGRTDRPAPSHHVFLGREFWDDDPNAPRDGKEHCELPPEYVMFSPLNVTAVADDPNAGPPGSAPVPMGSVTLRPGVRLSAEPGRPTTIDGEPGTAYVWSPAEDPWLRAEFVLDQRNQLRSAVVTDTARNEVIAEMSARPTDARIQRPDWTEP